MRSLAFFIEAKLCFTSPARSCLNKTELDELVISKILCDNSNNVVWDPQATLYTVFTEPASQLNNDNSLMAGSLIDSEEDEYGY